MRKLFFYCTSLFFGLSALSQNACPPNVGFDQSDFSGWQCYAGTVSLVSMQNVVTVSPTAPVLNRHTIIPPTSLNDQFGGFPITPDNNPVARLGFFGTTGADAEVISYTFNIPASAASYSMTYKYAVVYQNPNHVPLQSQPKFAAKVFDVTTGQYIPNACFEFYYGTSNANGFLQSPVISGGAVMYKPWTPVTFLLADYAGHTIRIEFTNTDCPLGGHWSYAYVDVQTNCNAPFTGAEFCPSGPVSVVGPFGYQKYNWWNSNFTQKLDTTQSLNLSTPPTTPTTYALDLISENETGFRDTLFVTVKPHAAVTADAGLDRALCGTGGSIMIGTAANPSYKYSWSPTTGLSNPNIAQPVAQPSATTTYVLTATDSTTGCNKKDTVTVSVNILAQPVISLSGNVLSSSAATGNQWYLNGTMINGATGQTFSPTVAGLYTVIVTMNGCTSTASNGFNYSITGIDAIISEWKLKIGPNPLKDQLVISYGNNARLDLEILDLNGRRLFSQEGIPSTYTVDLSKYVQGTYLLRLTNSKTKQELRQMIVKM